MPRVRITGLPRNEQGDAVKKVRITKVPKAQAGGTPITHGLPDGMDHMANVEAEGGEVYQNQAGGIVKISDQAPDHEQGGVMLPDAERVLEDTSTKRKDKYSKTLKMSPDEVESIFGFKPKKPLSHAQAFEEVKDQYGKQIKNFNTKLKNTDEEGTIDKLSANTVRLNMMNREAVPKDQDIFDTLFEHQEAIKAVHEIPDDGKQKYGGYKPKKAQNGVDNTDNPDLGLYKGPKNPAHRFTPTGKTSEAKLSDKELVDAYKKVGVDFGTARGADLQNKIYGYLIENEPDALKGILKEYGPNLKAVNAKVDKKLKAFTDPENASKEDLKAALPYLLDKLPGARIPIPSISSTTEGVPAAAPAGPAYTPKEPTVDTNLRFINQPKNQYHENTNWYDLAPGIAEGLDSLTRDPELYNPVQLHQLKYKLLNPAAALYANQSDYEAGLQALQSNNLGSGVAAANVSNLTAQKYKANQQVLGAYENQNVGIQNREIDYNTNVRDRQSLADAQSRSDFYRNVLQARDNQRLQKLQAIQDLSRVQQLKARQNASLNLVSKLSPAFNQRGEYNGYQYVPVLNPESGFAPTNSPARAPKKSTTIRYKTADGKTISERSY